MILAEARTTPATNSFVCTGVIASQRRPSARPWLLTNSLRLGSVMVGTGLALLRLPLHVAFDQIWAENGQTFMDQEVQWGTVRSIATGYQGYAHLVPRLSAALVSTLPLRFWPAALTLIACLVTSICALAVYEASASVIGSYPWRVGLALMVVMVPAARIESVGSIINVQYVLAFSAMWVAFGRSATRRGALAAALLCLVAGGTTPFTGMAALIAASRWVEGRRQGGATAYQASCMGGLFVGLSYQVVGCLTSSSSRSDASGNVQGFLHTFAAVLQYGVLGSAIGSPISAIGVLRAIVIVVCLVLLAIRASRHGSRSSTTLPALTVFGFSAVIFTLVEYEFRYQGAWGGRYLILPTLCLMSAFAIAGQRSHGVGVALGLTAAIATAGSFSASSYRDSGPAWSAGLHVAARTCRSESANRLVTIPISPQFSAGRWHITLRCTEVPGA